MTNFDYQTPTRLIFGKDVVNQLPEVLKPLGQRVLITYGGGSIKRIGLYAKVMELLKDFDVFELPGIEPNPKYSTSVVDGVRLCKEHNIDVILSVGGGSVLDCSKAIAAGALYYHARRPTTRLAILTRTFILWHHFLTRLILSLSMPNTRLQVSLTPSITSVSSILHYQAMM